MQAVTDLYRSIVASTNHWFETKLVIDGVGTFTESDLRSVKTSIQMFQETPELGKAVAGSISVKMRYPTNVSIPRMARMTLYVRACGFVPRSSDATDQLVEQQSNWLMQGVYYIDTRERTVSDHGESVLDITGYDAMLLFEQPFRSSNILGDSVDTALVADIASSVSLEVDSRTYNLMTQGYTVPLPIGYTFREVLGYIAAMYVGCFIITEEGKLRLVSLLELPPETNFLITEDGESIQFGTDLILV